jgi:methylenetetrahydrofolate reductase (NADPH)
MGYDGAHIEGPNLRFEDIKFIVERSREIAGSWKEFLPEFHFAPPNPFYLFEGGEMAGAVATGQKLKLRETRRRSVRSLTFWMMQIAHKLFFIKGTAGYKLMASVARFTEKRKVLNILFTAMEHFSKRVLFVCRYCDDCALVETFYVCPESQCPKGMRVGPCGGSRVNERCEVFPDRDCFWKRVYWRAKNRGECESLRYLIPPRDWRLYNTSSWANYFLERDHASHPLVSCAER